MKEETGDTSHRRTRLVRRYGRFWFSAQAERRFYFFLTLIMLATGILYKMGVL